MEGIKASIVLIATLLAYIAWVFYNGIQLRKLRIENQRNFKNEAEKNGCCTKAARIKCKTRYQKIRDTGNAGMDMEPYDRSTYEYKAEGRSYRFSMNFDLNKSPLDITVWYKKGSPRKRILSCDNGQPKFGCLISFVPPVIFGVCLYGLLSVLGIP